MSCIGPAISPSPSSRAGDGQADLLLYPQPPERKPFMNEHTERNPSAFQDAINKSIEERPLSERIKEPGKNGPSLDSEIREIPKLIRTDHPLQRCLSRTGEPSQVASAVGPFSAPPQRWPRPSRSVRRASSRTVVSASPGLPHNSYTFENHKVV